MEGDGEGGLAEIVTLRPVEWIDQVEAVVGGSVWLELEEMDVRGMATVLAIEPCPPIAAGPGRVVLSTTVRHAVPVLTLSLAGTDEVLELTSGHRLFSEDRGDWVPASELQPGERLRTGTGSVAVAALEPKPGLHTVFNLEVETDHCYLVGEAQVLSHNANPCGPPAPPNRSPSGSGRQGAFNQAKRDSGIPTSQQPSKTSPNTDRRGRPQPGRTYEFETPRSGGGTDITRIRDDAGGHNYGPGNPQNRGPHFNTEDGGHYDY